ncbi:hypothetical protein VaNZ11_005538 [Volvox africanus]|uniref:EF-hand domain-containing protein n=1 Tax=Volvox africanus TaxID=51714 RepID=A0ABQ5RYS7_9CHLO|nr:hypothetical protein VaNZ11_005538 [Volvox africanus]
MSTLRPLTAFEVFLQRRQQQAEAHDIGASEPRWTVNVQASTYVDPARPQPLTASSAAGEGLPLQTAGTILTAAPPAPPRPLGLSAHRASQGRGVASSSSSGADRPTSRQVLRRSAPDLIPQVVASLPTPRVTGAGIMDGQTAAVSGGGSGSGSGRPPPAPSTGASASTAVYGELATAAASLASAASKLARGSQGDRSVAVSYENLAQAAADLAASACMIRPLTSAASGGGSHGGATRRASNSIPPKPSDMRSLGSLPRAVDPTASAPISTAAATAITIAEAGGSASAAAASVAAKSAIQQQPQQSQQPPTQHTVRPGTGSSARRRGVNVPRFPGYNPLVHLLESDMPLPGAAAAPRPNTSSPITHQLAENRAALQSSTGGNATAASHLSRRHGRRSSSGPGTGFASHCRSSTDGSTTGPPSLHPGDVWRAPMYNMTPDGQYPPSCFGTAGGAAVAASAMGNNREIWLNDQAGTSGGPWHRSGGGGGGAPRRPGEAFGSESQLADPHTLLAPYNDVRVPEWTPPEGVTTPDMDQDEVDARYNKVLVALRERVYTRGAGRLAAAFRDLDRDGSGMLSRRDFTAVLQAMNLGPFGLVDDKVVDLMLAAVDGGGNGWRPLRVSYGDFVNALRFGTLPWRGYNRKVRHRLLADPDQPIGPPQTASGLPPYSIAYGNNSAGGAAAVAPATAAVAATAAAAAAAVVPRPSGRMGELRLAFRQVDHNADGVVEWAEFREALRRVGEQHRLQISDQQLLKIYQDADPDFSTGVDYEAFVAAYDGGRGVPDAAAGRCRGVPDAAADRLPKPALISYTYGNGGGATAGAGHFSQPAAWNLSFQWRPQDLPRALPPPMTPMMPIAPMTPLIPLYDQLDQLRCTGSADGLPAVGGGSAGGGGLRAPQLRWQLDAGMGLGAASGAGIEIGAPGVGTIANGYRPDGLRDMHAGAEAVLRRLGSASAVGRASVRV